MGSIDSITPTLVPPILISFASVTRAQEAAAPGDTVWLRGGTYVFTGNQVEIGQSKEVHCFTHETDCSDLASIASDVDR